MATGQPGNFSDAPYLSDQQKQLASDTFNAAVTPLRQSFEDQFKSKVNDLSQRGVLFGGLGNDLLSRTLKDQARIEGDIASQIGTSIGRTALDQAFSSNEAAKAREATRSLSELLADKSLASQQALQSGQQQFLSGENAANRALQASLQSSAQQYQAGESAANRALQQALQSSQQQFQTGMFDKEAAINSNLRAMQLALSGNLGGEAVQKLFDETLGPGFVFKPEGQLALEQAAQASGLSVDEFNKVRRAMAQGQLADMFVDKSGQPFRDFAGNPTINPEYIDSPEKSRAFQMGLAKIYTDAQLAGAKTSADAQVEAAKNSAKVICTELYRQGKLPYRIYKADCEYARTISPVVVEGYHRWGVPLARLMAKSPMVTFLVRPFATAWAYQMAYKMGEHRKPNYLGAFLEKIGLLICEWIGSRMQVRGAY